MECQLIYEPQFNKKMFEIPLKTQYNDKKGNMENNISATIMNITLCFYFHKNINLH
jgi:hypothetical protein